MSINPKQVKYTIKLAEAMALNGQVDQAVQLLRQAQLIEPKNPTIQARWAKILFQAGRLDEAINVCRRRLELGINRADVANAHNDLGVIYRQLGQSDKAIEQFKAALKVNPRHKSAQKNLESLNQPPPSGEKQHP